MDQDTTGKIREGEYVVVRRGLSDRVVAFSSQKRLHYGKGSSHMEIDVSNAKDCELFSSFKIKKQAKFHVLEKNATFEQTNVEVDGERKSGRDNRNIVDVVSCMTGEDIQQMKSEGKSGKEILDSLVSNSKNFELKTEYSQEKYLKKKMLHYSDIISILPVDLNFLCQYYGLISVVGLSQLLTYSNVHSNGNYVIYETGLNGVVVAAVMKRLGGIGNCVHVHLGSCPQRQAVNYMNFKSLKVLRSLDVFYLDRFISDDGPSDSKKARLEVNVNKTNRLMNEETLSFLHTNSIDGLIIAGKEHPLPLLKKILKFLSPSSSFAIYSTFIEPLIECYEYLKLKSSAVNIQIVDNFYRVMQVEVDRTHPQIMMDSSGEFILTGIYVLSQ